MKQVLGDCGNGCPNSEQYTCVGGKCRIKLKNWCYPGNDLMPCINVCETRSSCIRVNIKKGQFMNREYNDKMNFENRLNYQV